MRMPCQRGHLLFLSTVTSDRPYADRRETTTALDELTRAAGTQFDPQVVAALRQAMLQPATTTPNTRQQPIHESQL